MARVLMQNWKSKRGRENMGKVRERKRKGSGLWSLFPKMESFYF